MAGYFSDRLDAAIQRLGAAACVGFDPLIDRLPPDIAPAGSASRHDIASGFIAFGRGIIEASAPHIPAIKINIAFFEPYFEEGLRAYHTLVNEAHAAGMIVIGDVKRADIGHTSRQYAIAHLADAGGMAEAAIPDAITINPYFGTDGLVPFVDVAREQGRGVFVLVQTSNESASQVQNLATTCGPTVAERVASIVEELAVSAGVGASGFSLVGAVVSPRDIEGAQRLRRLMPSCMFLVPGFGAQGMTAKDVAHCFKEDGTGALITASRSVIYAFEKSKEDWRQAVASAAADFAREIGETAKPRTR